MLVEVSRLGGGGVQRTSRTNESPNSSVFANRLGKMGKSTAKIATHVDIIMALRYHRTNLLFLELLSDFSKMAALESAFTNDRLPNVVSIAVVRDNNNKHRSIGIVVSVFVNASTSGNTHAA
jgi:hypothetical protein